MEKSSDAGSGESRELNNSNFIQVYPDGWKRIKDLLSTNKSALLIYIYLIENMGSDGSVMVAQKDIAAAVGVSEITVKRQVSFLCDTKNGIIVKRKTNSNINVYGVNPKEAWKSYDGGKAKSLFMLQKLEIRREYRRKNARYTKVVLRDR